MHENKRAYEANAEEYRKVYQECLARIDKVFSNGFTIVTMITVILTFTLSSFLGLITSDAWCNTVASNTLVMLLFAFLHLFLFALPVVIIFPFSAKFEDNLKAVLSTSAYLRAFYELPSIVARAKNGQECRLYAWETVHFDPKLSKARITSSEYLVLSIASLVFAVAISLYYSLALFNNSNICGAVFSLLAILIVTAMIVAICCIRHKTSARIIVNKYYDIYFSTYLDEALMLHVINEEEKVWILDYISRINKRDEKHSGTSSDRKQHHRMDKHCKGGK